MAGTGVQAAGEGDLVPEELVLALRDTGRALVTFVAFGARASDLGVPDLIVLARAADGDVVPHEAGRALGVRSNTMTMLSDRLEQRGLIRRVAHPADQRLVLLRATAKGRRLLDRLSGSMLGSVVELLAAAEPEERRFLERFLGQLTALLAEHQGAPAPAGRPRRRRAPAEA